MTILASTGQDAGSVHDVVEDRPDRVLRVPSRVRTVLLGLGYAERLGGYREQSLLLGASLLHGNVPGLLAWTRLAPIAAAGRNHAHALGRRPEYRWFGELSPQQRRQPADPRGGGRHAAAGQQGGVPAGDDAGRDRGRRAVRTRPGDQWQGRHP